MKTTFTSDQIHGPTKKVEEKNFTEKIKENALNYASLYFNKKKMIDTFILGLGVK